MNRLDRSSSLHKIVFTINDIVDTINSSMGILKTLDNSSIGEQVEYSSNQNTKVVGEVFTIKIPGLYTIRTSGSGTTSVLVRRSGESTVSETILLYTDQESEEVLLTSNDKLFFYVTSLRGEYAAHLTLKKGLFTVTQDMLNILNSNSLLLDELKTQISNSLESYATEYKTLSDSNKKLHDLATEQLAMMNNTIRELSEKIDAMQG